MEHHGLILNLGDATVAYRDARVELTKNELRILQMLLENAGSTVSREAIMMKLWESDSFVDDNTLSVNVARLRRRLAAVSYTHLDVYKRQDWGHGPGPPDGAGGASRYPGGCLLYTSVGESSVSISTRMICQEGAEAFRHTPNWPPWRTSWGSSSVSSSMVGETTP